jgi:SAM-dependent methyltransferase
LRRLYRLLRAFGPAPARSPRLPAALVEDCQVVPDRFALLERLPQEGVVAEVGTLKGKFAKRILRTCRPRALHLIDLDFSACDRKLLANPRVTAHQGDSAKVLAQFPDSSFDWIYVDAGHDYAAVRADALASRDKIRPGGYLVFNDFAHIDPELGRYGVHRAAMEFAQNEGWALAFLALDGAALYDVALRRPESAGATPGGVPSPGERAGVDRMRPPD